MLPLRLQLPCEKGVKYRFIDFFVFDYSSLPYLLSLFFWLEVPFPLVALDKVLPNRKVNVMGQFKICDGC